MSKDLKKLVQLNSVQQRLVLPTTGGPISYQNVAKLLKKLGIVVVRQKINGQGYLVNHITEKEALLVEEDFKRTHWRKFQVIAPKTKGGTSK